MSEKINRNAFISDLIDINQKFNNSEFPLLGEQKESVVYDHLSISSMFVAEGFNEKEIENMVKMFCPNDYELVLRVLSELISFST